MNAIGISPGSRREKNAQLTKATFWDRTWADVEPSARAMVGDAMLFLLGLLLLAGSFLALLGLASLGYRREFIGILESLHFWAYFAVLGVLLLDLGCKVAAHAFRRK